MPWTRQRGLWVTRKDPGLIPGTQNKHCGILTKRGENKLCSVLRSSIHKATEVNTENNKKTNKQQNKTTTTEQVKYLWNHKAFLFWFLFSYTDKQSFWTRYSTIKRSCSSHTCKHTHCAQSRRGPAGRGVTVSFRSGRVRRGNFFSVTDGRLDGWTTGWMEADKKAREEAQLAEVRSGIHRQQLQSAVTAAAAATAKPPSPAAAGHRPRVAPRTLSRRATVGFGPKLNVAFCIRLQSLGVPLEMRDKTRESSRQAPARWFPHLSPPEIVSFQFVAGRRK